MSEQQVHKGLSPSSLSLFMGCQRRYFHKKIAKSPIDTDCPEDLQSFEIGKAFHKVLELSGHELEGWKYSDVHKVVSEFEIDAEEFSPMIAAMLKTYKVMHARSGLKATHCEIPVETDYFYGIVDVILQSPLGWWIGDMKTSASYKADQLIPTLPRHPQLNLYAAHYNELAVKLGLDPEKFLGCRYRLTTKSKIARKAKDTTESFVERLMESVKSLDIVLPKGVMNSADIGNLHRQAFDYIEATRHTLAPELFKQNYGNCMNYFRPCEFFSKCHGKNFTEDLKLEIITSE